MSNIGFNDELKRGSDMISLDGIAHIHSGLVSVLDLNKDLHLKVDNVDHNWRVRVFPRGDFLINFPSDVGRNKFIRKGEVQCAGARISFSRWRFPDACNFNPVKVRLHLKLSGLPPSCWHPATLSFFLKGLGDVVEVNKRSRLGNGLLQVVVFVDVHKDFSFTDLVTFLHDGKTFIVSVEDLKFEKIENKRKHEDFVAKDDGFGDGEDDIGNSSIGGWSGKRSTPFKGSSTSLDSSGHESSLFRSVKHQSYRLGIPGLLPRTLLICFHLFSRMGLILCLLLPVMFLCLMFLFLWRIL